MLCVAESAWTCQLIPPFNEHGLLPPGVHLASLEEVSDRLGHQSELRRVQIESLGWLCDSAKRAGVLRLVINGSFVTEILEPNDIDCVLLIGRGFPADVEAESELLTGFPFLEIQLVQEVAFRVLVESFFATDRLYHRKGMIEVCL